MFDRSIALILVDIQKGFMPGGELPVVGGDEIVPVVNSVIDQYHLVVAAQDWHPADHLSFAQCHQGKKPYDCIDLNGLEQVLWPMHCVAATESAEFHPDLRQENIASVFRKGMNRTVDSYSAFNDNGRQHNTGLDSYLKSHGVSHLHIAGLAADYCVYYTIQDALAAGFEVTLLENATRAIDNEQHSRQKDELLKNHYFHLKTVAM